MLLCSLKTDKTCPTLQITIRQSNKSISYPLIQFYKQPHQTQSPTYPLMTTIRARKTIKQVDSQPPPTFLELPCFCGQIFTESQKLNSHMFQQHIHSLEFQKMKSITEQLSIMKHLHRPLPEAENGQTNRSSNATIAKEKKQKWKPKKPKGEQDMDNDLDQLLGINSSPTPKSSEPKPCNEKPPHPKQPRSESDQSIKQSPSELPDKPRRQQVRQFYNSRIFMCGQCTSFFVYSAQLNVHVSLYHSGEYPDGSIFGLKKHEILSFFKLPCERPTFPQAQEREKKFKCGCGIAYAASSSLVNHIKLRHNSVAPGGTQGLPHTKRIKQFIFDGDVITFAS